MTKKKPKKKPIKIDLKLLYTDHLYRPQGNAVIEFTYNIYMLY